MASALLLALAALALGFMASRQHLAELACKLDESIDLFVEAMMDLGKGIYTIGVVVYAIVMDVVFGLRRGLAEFWRKNVLLVLAALFRFIRKWWWVPMAGVMILLVIWGATSMMQGVATKMPELTTLLVFLAAVVIAFAIVYVLSHLMRVVVWVMLVIIGVVVILMALGVIALGFHGLAALLGLIVGLFIALLASVANVIIQIIMVALALAVSVPSCMQGGDVPVVITEKPAPAVSVVKAEPQAPFSIVASVVARPGDGCISLLRRALTEAKAKEMFGPDLLASCILLAKGEGRAVYERSDPKHLIMAPKICMKEVPGETAQPEVLLVVIRADGTTGIIMEPDSPICTPKGQRNSQKP